MLQITVPAVELWDEERQEFIQFEGQTLELEHSLISLSKWESKWCKPFLTKKEMSNEEIIDYIRCMTKTPNVDPIVYGCLTRLNIQQIKEYIEAPMTATSFTEDGSGRRNRDVITSELIYYWMVALQIPFECEDWHLNRLLTLIRICNIKNAPPKKRSKGDIMRQNAALNAARRQQLNTKG